jgi:hypothetical protein
MKEIRNHFYSLVVFSLVECSFLFLSKFSKKVETLPAFLIKLFYYCELKILCQVSNVVKLIAEGFS